MEPFDLRSNIKGKPGSQGTLFQVKDKGVLNPAQRWPKGYTPERLNDVRDAVKDTHFDTYGGPSSAPQHLWERQDRDHFAKTVAPSTIPASDLHGLTEVNHKHGALNQGEYRPAMRSIGWQLDGKGAKGLPKGTAARNIIHEIGHHVDSMRARNAETMEGTTRNLTAGIAGKYAEADWAARGKTGAPNETATATAAAHVSAGIAEGYADNYYTKHYRSPGRKPQQATQGRYEDIQTPEYLDGFRGYRDVRPAPHMGPQFEQGSLW